MQQNRRIKDWRRRRDVCDFVAASAIAGKPQPVNRNYLNPFISLAPGASSAIPLPTASKILVTESIGT